MRAVCVLGGWLAQRRGSAGGGSGGANFSRNWTRGRCVGDAMERKGACAVAWRRVTRDARVSVALTGWVLLSWVVHGVGWARLDWHYIYLGIHGGMNRGSSMYVSARWYDYCIDIHIFVSMHILLRLLISTRPCTYVLIDLNAQTVPA